MTKILFENVGREKMTFEVEVAEVTQDALYRAVKKKKCLMSRGIEFSQDPDTNKGCVIVGGCRVVGTFTILGEKP